ncbi:MULTISPECIES: GNAT family N-acetyltransferase [Paraburkholderia]|uniref:GNAT family N-acetyltransferase n=1 Tax=Paraburkholderia TaxID=1822464 RepID=UPI00225A1425|nr:MULTISPECIES: GNAT family N-acetyltransferase [Paraburkholderia]MCX4171640.1 GNAT family N-acetyltransferase [Paraburkholderia madseniana]MDQ6459650.1 GNAT family N-acetyltransferase [Paraburkholderia madseniana]
MATILIRSTLADCLYIALIPVMLPSIDELFALDALTLREHTEQAGDAFDVDEHRVQLRKSLEVSEVCSVRREGKLVAYAMLRPHSGACWFVGAFGTHPLYRTYAVITELLAKMATLASEQGIGELRSHVYKTNRLSIAFHRKLGFQVTRENDKGFEFFIAICELTTKPAVQRATARATCRPESGAPDAPATLRKV